MSHVYGWVSFLISTSAKRMASAVEQETTAETQPMASKTPSLQMPVAEPQDQINDLTSGLDHHEAALTALEVALLVHEGTAVRHGATMTIHQVLLAQVRQLQSNAAAKISQLRQRHGMLSRQITELHGANAVWMKQAAELGEAVAAMSNQLAEPGEANAGLQQRALQAQGRSDALQRDAQSVQRDIQLLMDTNRKLTSMLFAAR
jgi:chromosome segregation ATPase